VYYGVYILLGDEEFTIVIATFKQANHRFYTGIMLENRTL